MKGIITRRIGFWETLFRRLSRLRFLPRTETSCMIIPALHSINLKLLVENEPAVDYANCLCTLLERAYHGKPFRAEAQKVLWQIEHRRRRYQERKLIEKKKGETR